MSSAVAAGLEALLVFGSVLGLAVFELLRLRRDRRQQVERAAEPSKKPAPED